MKIPEDKLLEKAKLQLMMKPDTLFYSTILFSLVFSWTKELPTAGTDGTHLMINPEYFKNLTEPERIGLLAHEVLHVALSHMTRRMTRNPLLWNYAGDYIINAMLLKQNYTLPKTDLIDSKFNDLNTEQAYKLIFNEQQKNSGSKFNDKGFAKSGLGQDIQYPKKPKDVKAVEQGC
ncbi:MAG: hypothetical protein DRJ07_15880 [Bacteroidetes bacterium]|nr:MAG: hypothetical protein DRJ07_15880 [Bacteroidota bacterium]